ncbi:hypothetical protein KM043_004853 [Ampulex compressa]|nr:hypothetical protein KM043_004853 [Ampulex compressa]
MVLEKSPEMIVARTEGCSKGKVDEKENWVGRNVVKLIARGASSSFVEYRGEKGLRRDRGIENADFASPIRREQISGKYASMNREDPVAEGRSERGREDSALPLSRSSKSRA